MEPFIDHLKASIAGYEKKVHGYELGTKIKNTNTFNFIPTSPSHSKGFGIKVKQSI